MAKKQMLSRQTAQQYEKELLDLKLVDRPAVVLRIKDARAQGDLSENAE